MDNERSNDDTWRNPVEVIHMRAGYDWRRYGDHAPFFLCRDGRPIEVQGKYGNWWRACSFEPGPSHELHDFARAMAEARIEELTAALGRAIDYCDAALHGDDQYRDERGDLIRIYRGE